MTHSKINLEKLRELAERATPGPWHRDLGDSTYVKDADQNHAIAIACAIDRSSGFPNDAQIRAAMREGDRNRSYIAAVSPDTILTLVDALRDAKEALKGLEYVLPPSEAFRVQRPLAKIEEVIE